MLVCIGGVPGARAASEFSPYASIDYQHNSNVFAIGNGDVLSTGRESRADNYAHYVAGAVADLKWGLDTLALNIEGGRYDYAKNNILDHYDFRFGGTLDWRLTSIVSGDLAYEQGRTRTPPADALVQDLELQTDRQANGTVRFLLSPRWRLDLHPIWHSLDTPLTAYPDFGYTETTAAATINYLGFQKLTAGLRGEYLNGRYHDIIAATKYNQKSTSLTANYAVTGFSSFDMRVGYTWRDSSLVNPNDASIPEADRAGLLGTTKSLTGALGVTRRFTVKTSMALKVFREVGSYVASANPEISTGAELSANWNPDAKLGLSLAYRLEKESISGPQITIDQNVDNRDDRSHDVLGNLTYQATKWLSIRPYAEYQTRKSNLQRANYDTLLFGINVTARLNEKLNQQQ
jgi:hypothetical protein